MFAPRRSHDRRIHRTHSSGTAVGDAVRLEADLLGVTAQQVSPRSCDRSQDPAAPPGRRPRSSPKRERRWCGLCPISRAATAETCRPSSAARTAPEAAACPLRFWPCRPSPSARAAPARRRLRPSAELAPQRTHGCGRFGCSCALINGVVGRSRPPDRLAADAVAGQGLGLGGLAVAQRDGVVLDELVFAHRTPGAIFGILGSAAGVALPELRWAGGHAAPTRG